MINKIIQLLHLLLIIGIISSIFINDINVKNIFFTLLIFLFMQYITNYGKCGLTELEYIIKGEKYQEGFLYRLIKPIIVIPEKYFNKYIYILHIIWIIILAYQLDYFNNKI
jgi:hypothetical protein